MSTSNPYGAARTLATPGSGSTPATGAVIARRRRTPLARAASLAAVAAMGLAASVNAEDWGAVGQFSVDSVVAGQDIGGGALYPCRTARGVTSLQIGKTQAGWTSCNFAFGTREEFGANYQVLTTDWRSGFYFAPGSEPVGNGFRFMKICRALIGGGLHPGKKFDGASACLVPYGGREVALPNHETLSLPGFALEELPGFAPGAIAGGREASGALLYPCIASYLGGRHPGKTQSGWGHCAIAYGNTERYITSYTTLVPVFRDISDTSLSHYVGGFDLDLSELGICTANYAGSVQVGKFVSRARTCNLAFGTTEVILPSGFKTLRVPQPVILL
jgi:hypothetical protein